MADPTDRFRSNDAAVNWFAHALADDVGWVEWIPKTEAEMADYKKSLPNSSRATAYPLKAITHPIPDGDVVLVAEGSKSYAVACNGVGVREMLIGLAQRYEHYRDAYHRLLLADGKTMGHQDVRHAAEDLREAINSRRPDALPESFLDPSQPPATPDVMTAVAAVLASGMLSSFGDGGHGAYDADEMLVERNALDALRVAYQAAKPDGGFSRPYPKVVCGCAVEPPDDGLYQKPRRSDQQVL